MHQQGRILTRIGELVDTGELKPTVRTTLESINAANLREAHAQLEAGQTVGKIVLSGWG
jgi:NADPH:quinone reductase-like Zn-dependent oxidoreductase